MSESLQEIPCTFLKVVSDIPVVSSIVLAKSDFNLFFEFNIILLNKNICFELDFECFLSFLSQNSSIIDKMGQLSPIEIFQIHQLRLSFFVKLGLLVLEKRFKLLYVMFLLFSQLLFVSSIKLYNHLANLFHHEINFVVLDIKCEIIANVEDSTW